MSLKATRRKKYRLPQVEVNIISLMDILTTMLFFLLVFASFSNFSVLRSTALVQGTPSDSEKPTFTLEVRMKSKKFIQVWIGPIDGLKMVNGKKFRRYLSSRYRGNAKTGYTRNIISRNPEKLLSKLQKLLVPIKKAFPHESRVVLSISDNVEYQQMIDTIGTLRQVGGSGKAFELEDLIGKKELTRVLFSQVIVAELQKKKEGA